MNNFLPINIEKVGIPPIKCQGIKTKLIKFIAQNIQWEGKGRWIEPFLGSGVVLFNLKPKKALVSDTNFHIISFYKELQQGLLDEFIVRDYLNEKGNLLSKRGESFYYQIRDEFNLRGGSLPFLFLNRSCFNGLMRFNSDGKFNVPFGKKIMRFSKSYITKIVNQVARVRILVRNYDWEFVSQDYKKTLNQVRKNDFIYLDPPYVGRHNDYYNSWSDSDAIELSVLVRNLDVGYALSMWKENKYRSNNHLDNQWNGDHINIFNHFYHIGSKENLRNEMLEALVIKKGFWANSITKRKVKPHLETFPIFD